MGKANKKVLKAKLDDLTIPYDGRASEDQLQKLVDEAEAAALLLVEDENDEDSDTSEEDSENNTEELDSDEDTTAVEGSESDNSEEEDTESSDEILEPLNDEEEELEDGIEDIENDGEKEGLIVEGRLFGLELDPELSSENMISKIAEFKVKAAEIKDKAVEAAKLKSKAKYYINKAKGKIYGNIVIDGVKSTKKIYPDQTVLSEVNPDPRAFIQIK